jgi:hypothetical protein
MLVAPGESNNTWLTTLMVRHSRPLWHDAPLTNQDYTYRSREGFYKEWSATVIIIECQTIVSVSASPFVLPIPYSIPYAACPPCKRASRGLDPIDVRLHLDSVRAGRE